ncbi:hypothetical protein NKI77_33200 [Mesorhizobium opportunistum]|uniref:hypothetical protein n=1 Tax=Mesorhizobium opportunistum TaxID=593909 RepID=UPI003335FFD9
MTPAVTPISSRNWSMLSLANVDPFPSYDEVRKRGPLVWDSGMNCWLAVSYDACKITESDEDTFRIMYSTHLRRRLKSMAARPAYR